MSTPYNFQDFERLGSKTESTLKPMFLRNPHWSG